MRLNNNKFYLLLKNFITSPTIKFPFVNLLTSTILYYFLLQQKNPLSLLTRIEGYNHIPYFSTVTLHFATLPLVISTEITATPAPLPTISPFELTVQILGLVDVQTLVVTFD